jgi:hypothetical protein
LSDELPDKRRRRRAIVGAGALALGAVVALILALTLASGGSEARHRTRSLPAPFSRPPAPPQQAGPLRPGPPDRPAPTTEQLGVNIGLLFSLRIYNRAQIDAQLSALARTGATLVRTDAPWEATEPRPPVNGVPHYHWTVEDGIVGALAAHRLQWLPIIDYSPPWVRAMRGVDHSGPASAPAYAAYAGSLAARYGVGGSFWRAHPQLRPEPVTTYEIWNEPDSVFFWKPHPNPTAYARLYLRARAAITAAAPRSRVIVGGLTRPARFLPAMLSAEPALRGHIDGVGIHPYGRDPQVVLARVRQTRGVLRSLGMSGVPLYVTEFGWRTQPAGSFGFAPPSARPHFILQTITGLRQSDCGVAAVLLYAWFTPVGNPGAGPASFGIDPSRPGPSPAVSAFTRALSPSASVSSATHLCSDLPAHP